MPPKKKSLSKQPSPPPKLKDPPPGKGLKDNLPPATKSPTTTMKTPRTMQEVIPNPPNKTATQRVLEENPEAVLKLRGMMRSTEGLDISLLKPRKEGLQAAVLADSVLALFKRMNTNNLLWYWRATVSRAGLGSWNDTPPVIQNAIKKGVRDLLTNKPWVEAATNFHLCYRRTWSPEAMARTILFDACYKVILGYIEEFHNDR